MRHLYSNYFFIGYAVGFLMAILIQAVILFIGWKIVEKFTFTIAAAGIDREHAEDFIKSAIIHALDSVWDKMYKADGVKLDKLNEKRQRLLDMSDSIRPAWNTLFFLSPKV